MQIGWPEYTHAMSEVPLQSHIEGSYQRDRYTPPEGCGRCRTDSAHGGSYCKSEFCRNLQCSSLQSRELQQKRNTVHE